MLDCLALVKLRILGFRCALRSTRWSSALAEALFWRGLYFRVSLGDSGEPVLGLVQAQVQLGVFASHLKTVAGASSFVPRLWVLSLSPQTVGSLALSRLLLEALPYHLPRGRVTVQLLVFLWPLSWPSLPPT